MLFSEPKIPQSTSIVASSRERGVSVLFSEPKIPQSGCGLTQPAGANVSVLFSEPKIPQCAARWSRSGSATGFSALQRAENSSIRHRIIAIERNGVRFSALQRAENSSIFRVRSRPLQRAGVSVLFSEPKIPQFQQTPVEGYIIPAFQCSSASRKFLNWR